MLHHRKTSSYAFTLVEILVTVVIIGIAGAIVVPHMLDTGQMQIQAAGRMIVSDILVAQNDSITRRTVRRIVFNTTNNRYRITDAAGVTIAATWKSGAVYVVDFANDSRFTNVQLGPVDFGGTSTLEFNDLGTPLSGGTVDLITGDTTYRVSVAPFTGRVTIALVDGG